MKGRQAIAVINSEAPRTPHSPGSDVEEFRWWGGRYIPKLHAEKTSLKATLSYWYFGNDPRRRVAFRVAIRRGATQADLDGSRDISSPGTKGASSSRSWIKFNGSGRPVDLETPYLSRPAPLPGPLSRVKGHCRSERRAPGCGNRRPFPNELSAPLFRPCASCGDAHTRESRRAFVSPSRG
jgi:hypothetical protein